MDAQLEHVQVVYTFFARLASICVLSRCLLTNFLHRSSVRSLLRVRCWLGKPVVVSSLERGLDSLVSRHHRGLMSVSWLSLLTLLWNTQYIKMFFYFLNFRYTYPTNISTTRSTPTATPLVVVSSGVKIWVDLGCSDGSFFFFTISTPALALGQPITNTLALLVGYSKVIKLTSWKTCLRAIQTCFAFFYTWFFFQRFFYDSFINPSGRKTYLCNPKIYCQLPRKKIANLFFSFNMIREPVPAMRKQSTPPARSNKGGLPLPPPQKKFLWRLSHHLLWVHFSHGEKMGSARNKGEQQISAPQKCIVRGGYAWGDEFNLGKF